MRIRKIHGCAVGVIEMCIIRLKEEGGILRGSGTRGSASTPKTIDSI